MANCDMVAVLTDGATITIGDYWSVSENTPGTDVSQGGTSDYFFVSGGLNSTGDINVVFKRKLDTGDQFDQVIAPDLLSQICWAYIGGSAGWQQHSNYGSAVFTWATNSTYAYFRPISDKQDHGTQMSIAWALFAVLGIVVARYFKHTWWWFYVHFVFLTITSIITIVSSTNTFMDDQNSYLKISAETFKHSRMGMILSSLVISQVVFGMLTGYFKVFTKNTTATILFGRAHRVVGYSMFISGLYNCYIGWDLYGGGMGVALIALGFIVTVLLFGVLETNQLCCRNRLSTPDENLSEITHFKVAEMIKEGQELMFADDLVVDVGHFKRSHPGGTFLIWDNIGQDAGKYMVGCSSYGARFSAYEHSAKAFSMLKSLAIGRIPYPINYMKAQRESNSNFMEFLVTEKVEINSHTSILYLKSEDWTMHNVCESPTWLGKHFMFTFKTHFQYVKRYYSSIFVDIFDWAKELEIVHRPEVENTIGQLKIIYKFYEGGKMTGHLNSLKTGEMIMIKGPLGPGLMLQELRGKYSALAGGTGLVPFLDLVHMAWKSFGNKCEFFSLDLFIFFREWNDGFALDILEKMSEKCDWLDVHIFTEKVQDRSQIGEKLINKVNEGMDMVWICGPSGFNRHYHDLLFENGLAKHKIILL